ncbi:hypothetical protein ACRPK6_00300 [Exiguobacterium sp. TRN 1102]|uniref:hypothetical protein n=1 Tax=Exiguobacterium sp. TRN 1102 TaxID=3420732 RepID=UPI003D786DFC
MIKNNHLFYLSLLLICVGLIGNILFENLGVFSNSTFSILSIPIGSVDNYYYQGLFLLFLTTIGLSLLPFSLNEKKATISFTFLVAVIIIPHIPF